MQGHKILFYQNPISKIYRAVCSCGWTLEGEKEFVQGRAACHDLNTGEHNEGSLSGGDK